MYIDFFFETFTVMSSLAISSPLVNADQSRRQCDSMSSRLQRALEPRRVSRNSKCIPKILSVRLCSEMQTVNEHFARINFWWTTATSTEQKCVDFLLKLLYRRKMVLASRRIGSKLTHWPEKVIHTTGNSRLILRKYVQNIPIITQVPHNQMIFIVLVQNRQIIVYLSAIYVSYASLAWAAKFTDIPECQFQLNTKQYVSKLRLSRNKSWMYKNDWYFLVILASYSIWTLFNTTKWSGVLYRTDKPIK